MLMAYMGVVAEKAKKKSGETTESHRCVASGNSQRGKRRERDAGKENVNERQTQKEGKVQK